MNCPLLDNLYSPASHSMDIFISLWRMAFITSFYQLLFYNWSVDFILYVLGTYIACRLISNLVRSRVPVRMSSHGASDSTSHIPCQSAFSHYQVVWDYFASRAALRLILLNTNKWSEEPTMPREELTSDSVRSVITGSRDESGMWVRKWTWFLSPKVLKVPGVEILPRLAWR